MLTNFEQFRDWVKDNGITRWALYKSDHTKEGDERYTGLVIDSSLYPPTLSIDEKLDLTRKHMENFGAKLYGQGFQKEGDRTGAVICEVRIDPDYRCTGTAGIGMMQQPVDESAIEKRIEARLRAEMERKEYERKRADLDTERKQFEEEKNSAMGALIHCFAPIGRTIMQNRGLLRNVAGVDAEAPVHAQRIVADDGTPLREERVEEVTEEPSPFTDEEADKLFELLARFKKAEPEYMRLLEAVVTMAENGDGRYTMAKGFLLK